MLRAPLLCVVLVVVGLALGGPVHAAGSTPVTVLRLDGIGPLKLGMKRSAALRTGWLADRGEGCPLGGTPVPLDYDFTGPTPQTASRARRSSTTTACATSRSPAASALTSV